MSTRLFLGALLSLSLFGCDSDSGGTPSDSGVGASDSGSGDPDAGVLTSLCPEPTPPLCQDESIQELPLFDTVSDGLITNENDEGGGFTTEVDASGGGFSPSESFVYARFEVSGLVKVDIDDEAALTSTDWDIAFRRFLIRLNSGVSGPSCVVAGRTPTATDYDTLTAAPSELAFRNEQYFTSSCDLVPDGSGLGSPGTALQSFWEYPGCVKMTGNVFVVRLANGPELKLVVTRYYSDAQQATCQATGMTGAGATGAGAIKLRWKFLGT